MARKMDLLIKATIKIPRMMLFINFRLSVTYKPNNQQLPPLAESCQISLMPPSPQPPMNVVVQSTSIIEHNPSSFVVAIDFTLQQPNETSALIKDLKHEYIITMTAPSNEQC